MFFSIDASVHCFSELVIHPRLLLGYHVTEHHKFTGEELRLVETTIVLVVKQVSNNQSEINPKRYSVIKTTIEYKRHLKEIFQHNFCEMKKKQSQV